METINGVVTWVQPNWRPYQPKWSRQSKEFRKFYIYNPDTQDSLECVAWERKYWVDLYTGQKVEIQGFIKNNSYNNKPQLSIRKVTLQDFYREFKSFTITDLTFRYNYLEVRSQSPWIRGSIPDENVHPVLEKYRHLLTEQLEATIEGEPKAVRFEMGKPVSWIFDKDSNAKIISRNWGQLEAALHADQDAKKWREFVLSLKKKLENNIIDIDDAKTLAESQGVNCTEQDILSVIFRPEYEKEYFDHLKDKSTVTKYTKDSFLFELKDGRIVWEKPKIGSATYLFKPQDINVLVARINSLQGMNIRSAIRSNSNNIADELQFSKIIIHRDLDQWTNDLEE